MGLGSQRGIVLNTKVSFDLGSTAKVCYSRVGNSVAGRVLCLGQAEDCGDGDVASLVYGRLIRAVIGRHTQLDLLRDIYNFSI